MKTTELTGAALDIGDGCTLLKLIEQDGNKVVIYDHRGALAVLWSSGPGGAVRPGQFRHGVHISRVAEFELTAGEADAAFRKLADLAATGGASGALSGAILP